MFPDIYFYKKTTKMTLQIESKIEHKTLECNGNTIHYYISGDKNKESIFFLHSAFSDHRCFDKQIDYFSSNYKVITIDLLGHGKTGVGNSKDKITSTFNHITEIMKTESIEKIHLVGVSLGSLLAQDFALKFPDKTITLTAVGGYSINKNQKEIARNQRKEMFKWIFKMIFSMDSFRRYAANLSVLSDEDKIQFLKSAKLVTRKSFRVMGGINKIINNRPNTKRNYPLLIITGEKDTQLAVKAAKEWHNEDPTSRLFIIENAGHCANIDNPKRFNEILSEFLKSE